MTVHRPYFCPASGDVECCPAHSGWDHCCDRPDLHGPVPCICPEPGQEGPVRWECLVHSGALNPDGSWSDRALAGAELESPRCGECGSPAGHRPGCDMAARCGELEER